MSEYELDDLISVSVMITVFWDGTLAMLVDRINELE
jgi:hypothetical protein